MPDFSIYFFFSNFFFDFFLFLKLMGTNSKTAGRNLPQITAILFLPSFTSSISFFIFPFSAFLPLLLFVWMQINDRTFRERIKVEKKSGRENRFALKQISVLLLLRLLFLSSLLRLFVFLFFQFFLSILSCSFDFLSTFVHISIIS